MHERRHAARLRAPEMQSVAQYFSAIARRPWVRVVETDTVPQTRAGVNGLLLPLPGGGTGPIGQRIVEVPDNPELTDRLRSPRSGYVGSVPVGSVARGEALVTTGGGKTVACTLCHGPNLQGVANVPGIADRPASYLVRQLYDIQAGTRQSPLMKPVVT